jgi:hypothetical protein
MPFAGRYYRAAGTILFSDAEQGLRYSPAIKDQLFSDVGGTAGGLGNFLIGFVMACGAGTFSRIK